MHEPWKIEMAHMRDERCLCEQIDEACRVYVQLLKEL